KKYCLFKETCIILVSQHALGGVVEVNEGAESVLLRCQGSYAVPEVNPSVLWSRNDLNPKVIHLRREQGDDHKDQNQVYRRRTSMHLDALQTGDFDLTLRKPQLADSGNYTCSISDGRAELKLAQVQLEVKGCGAVLHYLGH
uniref:Ig-like domain-containing protein n=1 Tax=Xiphophorus couchianus TaxID=32473 RepID=A0A3B5ML62_9TELE